MKVRVDPESSAYVLLHESSGCCVPVTTGLDIGLMARGQPSTDRVSIMAAICS